MSPRPWVHGKPLWGRTATRRTGYFFSGAAAGAAAGAAFFSAIGFASAFGSAFFALAAFTAFTDEADPSACFTTTLSPTLKSPSLTFSPAFRSTLPFFPFTVKVPAAASTASTVPVNS